MAAESGHVPLAKTKLPLLFLSKEKGVKGGRALALQILNVMNRNELYGLALYVAFSGLYPLCASAETPFCGIKSQAQEKGGTWKLICSFHFFLLPVHIYL
jgi:hypothetical protein